VGINNFTQFSYDGLWRNTKIVETTSGSVTSTRQFLWTGTNKAEERNQSGSVVRLVFGGGEVISGTLYYKTLNHLNSVAELTNSSSVLQTQYVYAPFGKKNKLFGSVDSEYQFAKMCLHERSGLNMAPYRSYSANLSRWLNRDPIEEFGGINLFAYVNNDPVSNTDESGLDGKGFASPCSCPIDTSGPVSDALGKAQRMLGRYWVWFVKRVGLPNQHGNDPPPIPPWWPGNVCPPPNPGTPDPYSGGPVTMPA